ncbi:hypothetical protein PInf_006642 [Phytophthora infestans]|nr:hypothetical protein PInf_006642 [Phytophthora infestans]
MLESDHELVTHCSFLLSCYYPTHLLDDMAKDIALDLREEAIAAADIDSEDDAQMDPGIAAAVGQGNEPLDAPIEVAGRSGVGEGVTSVGNLPAKRRASEAEEQKTYTEEGLKMVTKHADKMEQMTVDATVAIGLDQVKQKVLVRVLQDERVRGVEERLIPKQLITEEKDTALRREPELVVASWTKPEPTINVVTPELTPRASKCASQLVYADEHLEKSTGWNKNNGALQTKKTKSQEFTPLLREEAGVLTVSPQESTACENTAKRDRGSGMTDVCARSRDGQTMLKNVSVTNRETEKQHEKTEP